MASSYRDNYIYSGDEFSYYTTKVFCAWDHGIEDESTAKLKKKSIYNDFKVKVKAFWISFCCCFYIKSWG